MKPAVVRKRGVTGLILISDPGIIGAVAGFSEILPTNKDRLIGRLNAMSIDGNPVRLPPWVRQVHWRHLHRHPPQAALASRHPPTAEKIGPPLKRFASDLLKPD